jgi:hypothetical protein
MAALLVVAAALLPVVVLEPELSPLELDEVSVGSDTDELVVDEDDEASEAFSLPHWSRPSVHFSSSS